MAVAHCLVGRLIARFRYRLESVRLGEHNLSSEIDCENGECADPVVDIPIVEIIVHENYVSNKKDHDIALIRLARPVTFTDFVRPICLPVAENLRSKNYDSVPLLASGFGRTENGWLKNKFFPFNLRF